MPTYDDLVSCIKSIIDDAIEHWPNAENWESIENAIELIAKTGK